MSAKIIQLPKSKPQNFDGMMEQMRETYPKATRGIVLVFDDEATDEIDGTYFCNAKEMALASVLLAKIAVNWGESK